MVVASTILTIAAVALLEWKVIIPVLKKSGLA